MCSLTVIRGEAVDDVQVLPECLHVLAGSQHGPYLRPSVSDHRHVVLAKKEVMRGHLTCDLDALLLRCSDDQDLKKKSRGGRGGVNKTAWRHQACGAQCH